MLLHRRCIRRTLVAVCANALLIAHTNNRGYITAHDIDEAAHELQLAEPSGDSSKSPAQEFTKPVDASAFQFHSDHTPVASGSPWSEPARSPEFEPYFGDIWERPAGWKQPQSSYARGIGL